MEIINFLSTHGDLRLDAKMSDLTTIKMGGPIKFLVSPFDIHRLELIINFLKDEVVPYKVFGRGSNLICGSKPYDGCIISLKHLNHYYFNKDGTLYVEAGMMGMRLANIMAEDGYSGLEFASGIPGTIGGQIFMNAGAYKKEMSDIIKRVLVYDGEKLRWLNKEELKFSYRHSVFQEHPDWVILACDLILQKGNRDDILELMNDRLLRRRNTQPLDKPSAGSCFKNPDGDFAWRLIDSVGLRGYRYNDILVSEKHSNFIVNDGNGKAEDFIATINYIQATIKAKYGIDLKSEVELFNC